MPRASTTSRTQVWMDSLGEWSWPGRAAEAVEALPRRRVGSALPAARSSRSPSARRPARSPAGDVAACAHVLLSGLISALAALIVLLALQGSLGLDRLLGSHHPHTAPRAIAPRAPSSGAPPPSLTPGRTRCCRQRDRQRQLPLARARRERLLPRVPATRLRNHDAALSGALSAARQRSARDRLPRSVCSSSSTR